MACDIDEAKRDKLDTGVEFYTDKETMATRITFKQDVDWVVIATPNGSHSELIKWALKQGKNVLCEKPTVISLAELDEIKALEAETGLKVLTCLQLRFSDRIKALKDKLKGEHKVIIDLQMHRGDFYWEGWKGVQEQSGGLLYNIGVHYFDLMGYLFGKPEQVVTAELNTRYGSGKIEFEKGNVSWVLNLQAKKDSQYRTIEIDGERLNLTRILESLHNKVYEGLAKGEGVTTDDITPVIQLCEQLTTSYEG